MRRGHTAAERTSHPAFSPGGFFVAPGLLALLLFALAACEDPQDPAGPPVERELPAAPAKAVIDLRTPRFAGTLDTIDIVVSELEVPADAWVRWSVDGVEMDARGMDLRIVAPAVPDTIVVVATTGTDRVLSADTLRIPVGRQFVVLKADDVGLGASGEPSAGWRRFFEYVERYDLKAGIGLVARGLETGGPRFVEAVRRLARDDSFELWNHGYTHVLNATDAEGNTYSEFRGVSFEEQLDHLQTAQRLARDSLGVVMRAFGAPGNAIDTVTRRALSLVPELEVWFYGIPGGDALILPRIVEAEESVGVVSYERFARDYDPALPIVALQLHPASWSDESSRDFHRIVRTLTAHRAVFVGPGEYADYLRREGRAGLQPY